MEKAFGFDFVSSYDEWLAAARKQLDALRAVEDYLTDRGRDFLEALSAVVWLHAFADNAREHLNLIHSAERSTGKPMPAARNADLGVIIHRLSIIAANEEDAACN